MRRLQGLYNSIRVAIKSLSDRGWKEGDGGGLSFSLDEFQPRDTAPPDKPDVLIQ